METIEIALKELLDLEGYGISSTEVEEGKQLMRHRKEDEESNTISPNRPVEYEEALSRKLSKDNNDIYVKWMLTHYYILETEETFDCDNVGF